MNRLVAENGEYMLPVSLLEGGEEGNKGGMPYTLFLCQKSQTHWFPTPGEFDPLAYRTFKKNHTCVQKKNDPDLILERFPRSDLMFTLNFLI